MKILFSKDPKFNCYSLASQGILLSQEIKYQAMKIQQESFLAQSESMKAQCEAMKVQFKEIGVKLVLVLVLASALAASAMEV